MSENTNNQTRFGMLIVRTANQCMADAKSASEFSNHATIDKDGTMYFGKWTVTKSGDMEYDNGRYFLEASKLTQENTLLHMFSKAWIDWNEFLPAYFQALSNTKKQKMTIQIFY